MSTMCDGKPPMIYLPHIVLLARVRDPARALVAVLVSIFYMERILLMWLHSLN